MYFCSFFLESAVKMATQLYNVDSLFDWAAKSVVENENPQSLTTLPSFLKVTIFSA